MLIQPTLPGIQINLADIKPQSLGVHGEHFARLLLEQSGYHAVITRRDEPGDLRATHPDLGLTWVIEVKTARRGRDGYYRFTLWKLGKTNHHDSDLIILLAVTPGAIIVPFIIPAQAVAQHHIVIPSDPAAYAGCYARFRQPVHGIKLEIEN
jgi:hypothetical protein